MTSEAPSEPVTTSPVRHSDPVNSPQSLAEVFVSRATIDPDSDFLFTIPEATGAAVESRTYAEILTRSERLRATLEHVGVRRGEPVGCYLVNSPSWIVASLAVWHAGGVVAAVGTLMPSVEASRLFELAGVRVVVRVDSSSPLDARFDEIVIDEEGFVVSEGSVANSTPSAPLIPPDPDAVACIFFTSGTTGLPKGITHTHRDFVDGARKVASAYAKSDTYRPRTAPAHLAPGVVFNPFGHTAGYGRLGFRLWIGRPSILLPRFSVAAVRSILDRYEFDSLQLSPAMVYMLATTEEPLSLGSIAYVTSGTAPLAIATRERFERRFGIPVMQAYGMTEVGTIAQERFEDVKAERRGPGSVGRIAQGVEIRIREPEGGPDVASGEDGEIYVRTNEMPTEFVGGSKVPVDEDGWFATGDLGHLDEHPILYLTGRVQEKLIVGGFNVYPAEIEDVARQSDGVLDVVVVAVADERLGEIPVAGVVWQGEPNDQRLIAELRAQLAHYKVPRFIFNLNEIPLTPRDKVDRRAAAVLAKVAYADSFVTEEN